MRINDLEREYKRLRNSSLRDINGNYRDFTNSLKSLMANVYEKYNDPDMNEMLKYDRIKKVDKDLRKLVVSLYGENSKLTRATLRDVYRNNYTGMMDIARERSGKKIRGILKDQDVTAIINEPIKGVPWGERMRTNRDNFNVHLERTIREGLSDGDTYSQMARRLTERVGKDLEKPKTIVRTESARVRMKSRTDALDHANAQGVKMTKKWRSAQDERVRTKESTDGETSHKKMDGVTIPYEEDFTLPSGAKAFAPTQSGNASDDINCRCEIIIDFE